MEEERATRAGVRKQNGRRPRGERNARRRAAVVLQAAARRLLMWRALACVRAAVVVQSFVRMVLVVWERDRGTLMPHWRREMLNSRPYFYSPVGHRLLSLQVDGDGLVRNSESGPRWPTAEESAEAFGYLRGAPPGMQPEPLALDAARCIIWGSSQRADAECREAMVAEVDERNARIDNDARIGRGMQSRADMEQRAETDAGVREELRIAQRRAGRRRMRNEERIAAATAAKGQGTRRPVSITYSDAPPSDESFRDLGCDRTSEAPSSLSADEL